MSFASDNASGVPPEIIAALTRANDGYTPSYGADAITDRVRAQIRDLFEAPEAEVFLVTTGTAANALSLALLCPPWGAVFCHAAAHVEEDECGAPEFYTGGAKLVLVPGAQGKIAPNSLAQTLGRIGAGGVHGVQRGMLTITNLTEAGTLYMPAEVAALTALARARGLPCHMDGSRFANAIAATSASPADMTWRAGIDVLSFGGTKNGLMGVEAVVIFDPARAWEFELRRKRGGHLISKGRYLAAQMEAYLAGGLWLQLAAQANAMAARLAAGIATLPGASVLHPVQGNIVFASWPQAMQAKAAGFGAGVYPFIPQPDGQMAARLVASWSTTEADVDRLIAALDT